MRDIDTLLDTPRRPFFNADDGADLARARIEHAVRNGSRVHFALAVFLVQ